MRAQIAVLSILCALIAGLAAFHAAAEQVGTAVVKGRTVILDGNGTWRYKDDAQGPPSADGCDTVEVLEVCAGKLGWTKVRNENIGDYSVLYVNSGKYYFGIIVEPYGTEDGVNMESLQRAIIENAATFTNTTPSAIPVLGTESEVKGLPGFRSVTYSPSMSGTPFVFRNMFSVLPKQSIQMVFWGIGKQASPEFTGKVDEALKQIRVK